MAPRMPLSSGTKLGPYEIQSSLGAGGMVGLRNHERNILEKRLRSKCF